jgi:hypothetical protein
VLKFNPKMVEIFLDTAYDISTRNKYLHPHNAEITYNPSNKVDNQSKM